MLNIDMTRRGVLKSILGMTAALLAPEGLGGQTTQNAATDRFGEVLPRRKLGSKGPLVTMLGMGGAHVGTMPNDAIAQKTIETAIAGGIRYFDTAANYSGGLSEQRYGKFLTPKFRDEIFLVSKTMVRTAAAAQRDLDNSLSRMKTDHLDLWHMHSIHTPEDVDDRLAGGVLAYAMEAQQKGKVKHIGFSGHVTPDAHRHMLERGGAQGMPFTACQMPVNVADPSYRSFILNVMPKLVESGVGVLAMKTLSNGGFFGGKDGKPGPNPRLVPDRLSVADALHFVWSLPISVLVTGADNPEMIQEKIDLARSFSGMPEQRRQELIARVADLGGVVVESYKDDERSSRGARAGARRA